MIRKREALLYVLELASTFFPLAFTAHGVWNYRLTRALTDRARFVFAATGSENCRAMHDLIVRLSVAL